jgi:hypothetical protein
MRQAIHLSAVAVQPQVEENVLIASVHHHYRNFSIGIDEGSGKELAPAG